MPFVNFRKFENTPNICLFEILSEIFLYKNFTKYGTAFNAQQKKHLDIFL